MYTIVGYDKDNDVYEVIDDGYTLSLEAEYEARKLLPLLLADKLRRANGEPFDWLEIYHDWGGEEETIVWASYDVEQSFTAFLYEEDGATSADLNTYDNMEEAIAFAKERNWDEVVNDFTGKVVWKRHLSNNAVKPLDLSMGI